MNESQIGRLIWLSFIFSMVLQIIHSRSVGGFKDSSMSVIFKMVPEGSH